MYGINFGDKYKKLVRPFGLEDQVFKRTNYYDNNYSKYPKFIEIDILSREVEPYYDKIMSVVGSHEPLTEDLLQTIALWILFSDLRKPSYRNDAQRISEFTLKTISFQRYGSRTQELDKTIESVSVQMGKKSQLYGLSNPKMLKNLMDLFLRILCTKRWRFLKAVEGFTFWTNDSPGFSVNTNPLTNTKTPYFDCLEMNKNSINYYPLSPYLCLEISPYPESGEEGNLGAYGYSQANLELMNFINDGVVATHNQMVIANNKEELEKHIKW